MSQAHDLLGLIWTDIYSTLGVFRPHIPIGGDVRFCVSVLVFVCVWGWEVVLGANSQESWELILRTHLCQVK